MLRSTNNAEAEGSEVAREGCRPFSPLLWRYPTGSYELGPSGGLSLLAEAAGTVGLLRSNLEPFHAAVRPVPVSELTHSSQAYSASYQQPVIINTTNTS